MGGKVSKNMVKMEGRTKELQREKHLATDVGLHHCRSQLSVRLLERTRSQHHQSVSHLRDLAPV